MADNRTRQMTFSSQNAVVQRWFGGERLDHSPGAVRMDFMNSGRAPLLMYHDQRAQVGIISSANIKDGIGSATVRFGRTSSASDALQNVDDGILTNTSVGYRVHEMVLESETNGEPVYRVTDWEPYEASGVGVPADPAVGFGRTRAADPYTPDTPIPITDPSPEARTTRASSVSTSASQITIEVNSMTTTASTAANTGTDGAAAAAATRAEPKVGAVEAERERREAIVSLCKANKIDSRVEARWIEEGTLLQGKDGVSSQILSVIEERGKLKPTAASALGLSGNETQRYSLIKAIRSMRTNADRATIEAASFELECSAAVAKRIGREGSGSIFLPGEVLTRSMSMSAMEVEQQRAMATQPGSKGGYMVNVTNMGFIDILRNRSVAIRMGARQLSGLQGNVTFARQTGKQSVTWQGGDGTSVTAADQALGQLSMTPKTAICVTDVSEQLLRQASPSAEQFIMADLAAVIAIDGVDNAAINGAGGAQPLGIKNTTGITSGQDASSATYAKILAFPQTAGSANAIRGNPGFVTNTAGASRLMQVQRFTSTDTPLWTPNMLEGTLVGFNAMSSEQLASGNIMFGSWDELVIGDWGVLELSTDNGGTRFNQAQVGLRALWMVDIMLRYPQAFIVGTNLS